jgi:hypothetical protein
MEEGPGQLLSKTTKTPQSQVSADGVSVTQVGSKGDAETAPTVIWQTFGQPPHEARALLDVATTNRAANTHLIEPR